MRASEFIIESKTQHMPESVIDEMALTTYRPIGNFEKPGPFRGVDKKLVPHPKNELKAFKFFEKTPYDFRLFFSNISGTGKYSEYGPMSPVEIKKIFGDYAPEIIDSSEESDTITVVFVGNSGDRKVMMTPWLMAHRFGHAVQAGVRSNRGGFSAWPNAEQHFFSSVNSVLKDYYGTPIDAKYKSNLAMGPSATYAYNALFNAIGTQRSSRTNQIRRPYEFMYELFAQYLGTGRITLNPFPEKIVYNRQYLYMKSEYRNMEERTQAAETLAWDMEIMFDDVLSSCVGKIFVM